MAVAALRRTFRWQSTRCHPKNHLRSEGVPEDRIWTARQLQEALATRMQVPVHPATLSRPLKRMGYIYKRTRYVPGGARGVCGRSLPLGVGGGKKGVVAGRCRVLFLDESGFGLWLPSVVYLDNASFHACCERWLACGLRER